jgi:hypothetical protein
MFYVEAFPRSEVLTGKLRVVKLAKKFLVFYARLNIKYT